MATYHVGIGGNDGNNGTTWALRKLTLNGAEDIPVAASDIVYVGPGCYREMLTVDVSGGAGTEIVYIGDVTGEHTDDVGGVVRITGSDNDQTATRADCIVAVDKDYREFRGFLFDLTTGDPVNTTTGCHHWTIEDCAFRDTDGRAIDCDGADQSNWNVLRCIFVDVYYGIRFEHSGAIDNVNHLVQNCLFVSSKSDMMVFDGVGDCTVRNCVVMSTGDDGIDIDLSPNVGHPTIVENCIFTCCDSVALEALLVTDITEDYNTFWNNGSDRTNVNVGANSQMYPPLFEMPFLFSGVSQASGFQFPWWFGKLSEWSPVRAITGSNEPTVDVLGILRPVTAAKNSWGALQFMDMERETGTVHAGSVSLCLHDAGRHQIFVPVANESTTISVYVYREANYAGNLPQMIVKQPGQADDVTTEAAAASQWNLLTTTLTPAADPPYVVVELVSRNTNGANDKVFFDDLAVS